jgi:hypothetical protein
VGAPVSWQHSVWPKDRHEEILELIRKAHDGKLPDWAIAADLVFHADAANHPRKPVPFPGRRALEKRWNVSERTARKALADPEWQEKLDALKIPRPSRALDGPLGATDVPASAPPASPHASPPRTRETPQSKENVPASAPPASPPLSTRAEILLPSSPPEEEQHVGDERRPAGEGKADKAPKAKRKTPNTAWVQQMTARWVKAWGDQHGTYPFVWLKDRETLAAAALAVGVELNQPFPPEALDHLERAMGAYIAAARLALKQGDTKFFPRGPPTVGRFGADLANWLLSTERTVSHADIPRASIEARIRERLKKVSIPEARAEVKASTRFKPPEITYALSVLDRLEASR